MCLGTLISIPNIFKAYNDTYGHQAGDHCLQLLAKAIKQRNALLIW